MRTMMKRLFVLVVVCGFFVVPDFTTAAVRRSPYSGIQHPTYASMRHRQQRSYSYLRYERFTYRPARVVRRYYYNYACPQPTAMATADVAR